MQNNNFPTGTIMYHYYWKNKVLVFLALPTIVNCLFSFVWLYVVLVSALLILCTVFVKISFVCFLFLFVLMETENQ